MKEINVSVPAWLADQLENYAKTYGVSADECFAYFFKSKVVHTQNFTHKVVHT